MNVSNWTLARLCLASGLLTGAFIAGASADDAPAGVTRISKPRTAAPNPAVQQTGFTDWVDSAADRLDTFNERVYGSPEPSEPGVPREPFRFPRFRGRQDQFVSDTQTVTTPPPPNGEVIYTNDGATVGGPIDDPYARIGYRDDWRTHQWNCDCKQCQFRSRMQSHSMAMENCCCKWCKHKHELYYHDCSGRDMLGYFHSKFGYFCPSGAGGPGAPFFGKYARVYPQDVGYSDGRDGQLFAAQGYGAPMAVPLAPVVGHTYNYGWGVPSSRLTPVSRLAPR